MTNPMWPLINGFRQFLECAPLGQLYLLHVHVHVGVPANKLQKRGQEFPKEEKDQLKQTILDKYEKEGSAYFSTSRLWDDGIIDPADTRKVLAMGIASSLNKEFGEPDFGVFRM